MILIGFMDHTCRVVVIDKIWFFAGLLCVSFVLSAKVCRLLNKYDSLGWYLDVSLPIRINLFLM